MNDVLLETKPVSIETEEHLIGAVLQGGRKTFELVNDIVSVETFDTHSLQEIWRAIVTVHEDGLQIDPVLIGDELERTARIINVVQGSFSGRAYLSRLREDGNPHNVESYAEQVQDYHFKRYLLDFASKMANWSANGRRSKDIIADMETELGKINLYSMQDEYTVDMGQAVSLAYDETDKASKGGIVGVPTGLIDLDKLLGSMYGGNVYLVAGRPGQGKTGLLLTIAKNAAQKHKKRVMIFSLESGRVSIAQRMIAQEAEVPVDAIMCGSLEGDEWPRFTHGVEVVADLPITINDLSSININEIRSIARKQAGQHGVDLIILDYIQLAGASKKQERRDLDVSEVSRGLKYLANELDVPILAAAQLNRAVEMRSKKRPILSDLRESGSLEQDAYCVMFIYHDEQKQNVAELIIAKHRNGPTGAIELVWRPAFTQFVDAKIRYAQRPVGFD